MAVTVLIVTNVFVYAYGPSDLAKQRRAVDVFETTVQTGAGVLSE